MEDVIDNVLDNEVVHHISYCKVKRHIRYEQTMQPAFIFTLVMLHFNQAWILQILCNTFMLSFLHICSIRTSAANSAMRIDPLIAKRALTNDWFGHSWSLVPYSAK